MISLKGRNILVVEDEFILARGLKRALEDSGAVVLGPDASIEAALARIENEQIVDLAVLDVNLHGEFSFPVADALASRKIPFIFVTGYDDAVTVNRYPDVPKCNKPFVIGNLLTTMHSLLANSQI